MCNLFNGAADSKARANIEAVARKLREDVGPVYSLQVAGQEESLVLVARRGEALPPPGVADLRVAARAAAQAAAMRLRALNLPYISPTSRPHLAYISAISRLYLPRPPACDCVRASSCAGSYG